MRGSLPPFVFGCAVAVGVLFSCFPVLAGDELPVEKLNDELLVKGGSERMAEIIETLRAHPAKEGDLFPYASLFLKACSFADEQRLPALIDIFEAVPDSYGKTMMFEALAIAWIKTCMPDKLTSPVASVLPTEPVFKERRDAISFLSHEKQYWQVVCRLLRGDDISECVQLVDRYTWGIWCGTGADRFFIPQAYAMIIGAMQEKRWSDVATEILNHSENLDPALSSRLLSVTLADPFDTISKWLEFAQSHEKSGYFWKEQRDGLLGVAINLADERRLDLLELLLPQMQEKAGAFSALGKFVPVGQSKSSRWRRAYGSSQRGLDLVKSVPASESEQKRALELLNRQAFTELGMEDARALARVLSQKYQPDSIPSLQQLLKHPSETVAEEAAEGLVELGEKAEIPKKLGDLQYGITVNGRPLSVWPVDYTVGTKDSQRGSSARTSEAGVLLLPRDWFLNPGDPVTRVVLTSSESKSLTTPRFLVEILPPSPGFDQAIPVSIETKALRLRALLPRPLEEYRGREMHVVLKSDKAAELSVHSARDVITLPVTDQIEFPSVAPGGYVIELRIPGTSIWRGKINVGENAAQDISLAKATDVSFHIKPPEPWRSELVLPELWKEGKRFDAEFDYEQRMFRGVPPGVYTLKVPSSARVRKLMTICPDGPEFGETERSFEIKADSPVEIDLGQIPLTAFPVKEEKVKKGRE